MSFLKSLIDLRGVLESVRVNRALGLLAEKEKQVSSCRYLAKEITSRGMSESLKNK